jgi:hypothetical protein
MMTPQLDEEEKELLDAYEAGEFRSDMSASRKKFLEEAAATTFQRETWPGSQHPGRDDGTVGAAVHPDHRSQPDHSSSSAGVPGLTASSTVAA